MQTPKQGPARQRLWQLHQPGHRLTCDLAYDSPAQGWMVSIALDNHHVGGYRAPDRDQADAWSEEVRRMYLSDGWVGTRKS